MPTKLCLSKIAQQQIILIYQQKINKRAAVKTGFNNKRHKARESLRVFVPLCCMIFTVTQCHRVF